MRLSDIHSQDLLPRFAALMAWICQAFDKLIKHITGRTKAIDAPLTIEAIEALTDEELQAYYEQYGLAEYYPDLSRDNRNWMLFQMARMFHLMGTPKAVETLCQYIFNDLDLHIQVKDNLAFDESGNLISSSLYDIFDVIVKPSSNNLPSDAITRIFDNVCRFARNSQTLRNIIVEVPDNDHDLPVLATKPYGGLMSVSWVENEDICEDVTPLNLIIVDNSGDVIGGLSESVTAIELETLIVPESELVIVEGEELETMEILLALKMTNRVNPTSVTFSANNYWWGGILSNEDKARVEAFGLDTYTGDYTYGEIIANKTAYRYDYTFEPLALYADAAGEVLNTDDMSNFYCSRASSVNTLTINNYQAYSTPSMTWKCRITRTIK